MESAGSLRALGLLACTALFFACRSEPAPREPDEELVQVRIGEVDWYVDYDAAAELARSLEKPMWVHFGENPG